MKKLAELWVTKKGLCVGIIAGVAVLTAGGITTAVVVSGQSGRKTEVQVASDETIEYTSKDNQTTKATEIKETTQKASEATTEESKEDGSSETQGEVKNNDGEIENPTEPDNTSSNNTQGSDNQSVPNNSNQTETESTKESNTTGNTNTESSTEIQTPAVVHGANGVILDTLTMYKKTRSIPVPKTTDEIEDSDNRGYANSLFSSETTSIFKDGINFGISTKEDVINRYGEPYKIVVQEGTPRMLYRYGNYTSDDNKVVYIVYCFETDNTLGCISIGSYKSMFE